MSVHPTTKECIDILLELDEEIRKLPIIIPGPEASHSTWVQLFHINRAIRGHAWYGAYFHLDYTQNRHGVYSLGVVVLNPHLNGQEIKEGYFEKRGLMQPDPPLRSMTELLKDES